MKAEAQRIAIAKACGWHGICQAPEDLYELRFRVFTNDANGMPPDEVEPGSWLGRHPSNSADACYSPLPDFLNDLDAMHEAEATLTPGRYERYVRILSEVSWVDSIAGATSFACIHASAAHRAEAFLRALNLWKDSAT